MTDGQLLDIWNQFQIRCASEPAKNYQLSFNVDGSGKLTHWDVGCCIRIVDAIWDQSSDACAAIQDEDDSND